MKADALDARYDRRSDVLYLTLRHDAPAISEEGDEPGVMWRYAVDDGALVGATILDYEAYWSDRISDLISSLSRRFHMSKRAAESALQMVH